MTDLLGVLLIGIIGPIIAASICISAVWLGYTFLRKQEINLKRIFNAFLSSLVVSAFFLFFGGVLIGLAFKAAYALPIVMVVLTVPVFMASFVVFLVKEISVSILIRRLVSSMQKGLE